MSRQLDSLLKGLSLFKEGMQTFSQNSAISEATTKAEELAMNADLDAEERLNQLDMVGNSLRLKLMGSGASSAKAETAGGAIGLTPAQRATLQVSQANAVKKTQADPFKMLDVGFKQEKFQRDLVNDFASQTKDLQTKIQSGMSARSALSIAAKNPAAAGSLKTLFAKQLQPGNLTDREQAVFEGSPQILNQVERLYTKYGKGEPLTSEDIRIMKEYNDTLLSGSVEIFDSLKSDFIQSNSDSMSALGIAPQDLEKKFDRFKFEGARNSGSSAVQKLKAALNDPQHKDKWPRIKAKIKEMEGK